MSMLAPKVESGVSTGDNTPGRMSTGSPRQIVPLLLGRGRCVVQWKTPVLRWHFRTTSRSQYAFFSCYGWFALGPIDELARIIVNDKSYFGLFTHRDASPGDHIDFTLSKETPEKFRFWWGLEDHANYGAFIQGMVDPKIAPDMVGRTHPNHWGVAAIAVQDMEAGQTFDGRTPPLPKVEIECYRRSPTAYSFGHCPWGTHPIGMVKDVLTLKRGGRGLPASMFVDDHWSDQMDRLYEEGVAGMVGDSLFTSLVLAEPRETDQIVADILSHFGGFLYERNGKLYIDWEPMNATSLDETGLRVITKHELAGEDVSEDPGDLESVPSQVAVTGLDWTADPPLTEVTESAPVPFVGRLVGDDREPENLNRAGFCTREQLKSYATMAALLRVTPDGKFTVPVLRQYALQPDDVTPLRAGDRFVLNLDVNGGKRVILRILERTTDDSMKVVFRCRRERGTYPQPAQPTLDPRLDPTIDPPADLARYSVAQLPPDLSDAADTVVAALIERPSQSAQSFTLEMSPSNTWPGQVISTGNTRFAVAAVLQDALASSFSDATVDVDTVGIDWGYFRPQSAIEQGDDALLAHRAGEWFSVGAITPVGGGIYSLALKRARLGSLPAAHAIGNVIFLILRSDLIALPHAEFANVDIAGAYDATTATKWFKARALGPGGLQGNLTAAFSLQLRDPSPDAPTGLTAQVGTGKLVDLKWNPVTASLVNEYGVYRATGPGFSDEARIGSAVQPDNPTDKARYIDINVVLGTQYRYRVRAEATDEVYSPMSGTVTATPGLIAPGSLDHTLPSAAGAPSKTDEATYLSDDGTVFSKLKIRIEALPANAVGQVLKIARELPGGGYGEPWDVGQYFNSVFKEIWIDDLTPGSKYGVWILPFNYAGDPGTLVAATGIPFTAPGKTFDPAAPTGFAVDSTHQHATGKFTGGVGKNLCLSVEVKWDAPVEKDVVAVEYRRTSGSGPTTSPIQQFNGENQIGEIPAKQAWHIFHRFNATTEGWAHIRFRDNSGRTSGWASINLSGHFTTLVGSIAGDDRDDVKTSGVKIGATSAGSVQQQKAQVTLNVVHTIGSAAPSESFNVSISGRGFAFAPSKGDVAFMSPHGGVDAFFDHDAGGNSASNAVIVIHTLDGSNLTPGNAFRLKITLYETN